MYWNFDDKFRLHAEINGSGKKGTIPVFFLHGFTGYAGDWQEITEKFPGEIVTLAIDLPGHGQSDSPEQIVYYTAETIIESLKLICDSLEFDKVILLGYSMGGRAALSFAAKYPERLTALILESTSPGLTDADDRKSRAESDEKLARLIEEKGAAEFADYWMSTPLFSTQKNLSPEKLNKLKLARQSCSKTGLANSLRGFSTGVMPELWSSLECIQCPVCLITGEMDKKFTDINREMESKFPNSQHLIIEGAGHNTHLEKPEVFLNFVTGFLKEIRADKM